MQEKLAKYGVFNDAVIIEVNYTYPGYDDISSRKKVKVIVDCITINQNWERISIDFEGVSEFFLREDRATNQIIDEVKIELLPDGRHVFDFSQGSFVDNNYTSDFYLIFLDMSISVIKQL